MTYVRLVSNTEQIKKNAYSFIEEISSDSSLAGKELVNTLSHFKSWVAVRTDEGFILAPSKWVGYADMDGNTYMTWKNISMDGRETENLMTVRNDWLRPVDNDHELWNKLHELCGRFGKKPNGRCRISILKEDEMNSSEPDRNDKLVDLLVAVYMDLSAYHQQEVRRRIG